MDERFQKARALGRAARQGRWAGYDGFFRDPNIVGTAIGRRYAGRQYTDEPVFVVYVARKVPLNLLPPSRVIPRRIYVGRDYLEVDVIETGPFYPLSFTTRDRPAESGISIGHPLVTAGTLGCLVTDNTDSTLCILSNNHVMANENMAAIGDIIIQPGTADGGVSPADDIARLKRFVTINAAGNVVDGAIAEVLNAADVLAQFKNNLMPYPSPDHPAVGLLFAGSCNRTIMNPIRDVLTQLDITLLAGNAAITGPDVGMNVEKVGRTTEYTTSTILEIDATVTVSYNFGSATFDHQIVTAWMSDGGDSGSLVCRGGAGGEENHCCLGIGAASEAVGINFWPDQEVEKEFRQRYLSQTLVGRYAIDLYFANEGQVVDRLRTSDASEDDRAFAQKVYAQHAQTVREVLLQPYRSETRLSREHLDLTRQALERARKYMTPEEQTASKRLYEIAERAEGRNGGEILEMLNQPELYKEVVDIMSQVPTLRGTRPQEGTPTGTASIEPPQGGSGGELKDGHAGGGTKGGPKGGPRRPPQGRA